MRKMGNNLQCESQVIYNSPLRSCQFKVNHGILIIGKCCPEGTLRKHAYILHPCDLWSRCLLLPEKVVLGHADTYYITSFSDAQEHSF